MAKVLTYLSVICIAALLLLLGCGGGGGGSIAAYNLSVTRIRALNIALFQYATDDDDSLPLGSNWMDVLVPYARDPSVFHSPSVRPPGYGYALNADIVGKNESLIASPGTTISVFDSTSLSRNAVASTATLPSPPRYAGHNTIAYVDGHVLDELGLNPSLEALYGQSIGRIRSLNTGLLIYSTDYDDFLPLSANWVDSTFPYVKVDSTYRSPVIERKNPAAYGYAFNSVISGLSIDSVDRGVTVSLFDSTVLTRNAVSDLSTLPNPPRYVWDNTIAFLDGHVKDPFGRYPTVDQLYGESQTRMKQVDLAIILYQSDNDDRMPLANQWADETLPYAHSTVAYRSPMVERYHPDLFGFAFNSALSGIDSTMIDNPAQTTMVFDSRVLTWNATADLTTLPNPPRYWNRNTIGYADGHVP